ncbi:TCP-1 CPN60 chaperonin family protein [Cryptosporidium andersoni]|uniref:T-complex protein 1 subunit epsilon n=1 Tax=Cryptosporidium andersoni TaxID=117008 RepID=A0A1J4MV37_9CRYT|nr:TCP-1 CPN60 chaperonin family protein [Cryptosporidium andersoni]
MSVAVDEYGNPFIIIREQDQKQRLKGIDAHKANILAAKSVADILKTSLGPKGMDKIIVSPDGEVVVTNDGATILDKMQINNECGKLLVELSKSQDAEIGDGTTGVVILAGALLERSIELLEKGIHPLRIASGYEYACSLALKRLEEIAVEHKNIFDRENKLLLSSAMTSLGSKVVSSRKEQFAKMAVEAILAVADIERKDINFDLISIQGKAGGRLEESRVVNGIVLDKEMSHPQMQKNIINAKLALLTCPFEPPKPKTKHKVDIKTAEDFEKLYNTEQQYFKKMITAVESSGANVVICQWGFDDEANHLLAQHKLPAIRWVGGVELELLAIATGAQIVPRFEDLESCKLGIASSVTEVSSGTDKDKMILIEGCGKSKAVTVLIRGGNQMVVDEAKRCIYDALCAVRNLIRDPKVVPGGGAPEIASFIAIQEAVDSISSIEQFAVRAFADALLSLPQALADNCGLDAISVVGEAQRRQITEKNHFLGIDCNDFTVANMMNRNIIESLASKQHQLALATQAVKMILKIDDIITPSELL